MSGLADTLLSRSRGSGAMPPGTDGRVRAAIEPRIPARYETLGDRLDSLETEASPAPGASSSSQPKALRAPMSDLLEPAPNAAQANKPLPLGSAKSPAIQEIRHIVRQRQMQQIPAESSGLDRATSPRANSIQPYPASSAQEQAADPIQRFQIQTQREAAPEAHATVAPRSELRKDESAAFARPIEPKVGAMGDAIKSAVDAALEPGIKGAVMSWLESKVDSRRDGERAAGTVRTRRKRAQQESYAKPLAAVEPVVEIHIGRIEIRAASPQPAPARRAQRQPISLEEYGRLQKGETR